MKTFLIFTEDKNREGIKTILAENFDGFTLLFGKGYWASHFPLCSDTIYDENSLVIVILTMDRKRVIAVAEGIKALNNQESVMVASFDTEMEMV